MTDVAPPSRRLPDGRPGYSLNEAAKILAVPYATLRRWVAAGKIDGATSEGPGRYRSYLVAADAISSRLEDRAALAALRPSNPTSSPTSSTSSGNRPGSAPTGHRTDHGRDDQGGGQDVKPDRHRGDDTMLLLELAQLRSDAAELRAALEVERSRHISALENLDNARREVSALRHMVATQARQHAELLALLDDRDL